MTIRYLDVLFECSMSELDLAQANSGQIILDKVRPVADKMVARVPGAELLTNRHVECSVSQGRHKFTDDDVYLIATRWPVEVPADWQRLPTQAEAGAF